MRWKNDPHRYSSASIALHWTMVVLVVGAYASAELREAFAHGSAQRAWLMSAHAFAGLGSGEGFPRTIVVVCELDGLRPSGEAFTELLRDAGVDVSLHLEAGADHAHINEPSDPTALPTIEAIAHWIRA